MAIPFVSGDQFPAEWAHTLPEQTSAFRGLEQLINVKQQNKALDAEEKRRKDLQDEREEAKRSQILGQRQDALKYHTGLQVFDDFADRRAQDILEKYSTDPALTNLPPAQFAASLNQAWLPIVTGYGAVKNKLNAETTSINQTVAQNKWIDKDQLTRDVYNGIASEYMQPDQNGEMTFVPPDRANYDQSFTEQALASPDAFKYANENATAELYKTIAQPKEENRNYILNNPDNSSSVYQGKLSPFETENVVPDEKGFVKQAPSYSIATEGRTDAAGNPINSLPKETMDNYMLNTAGNQMAFKKLFNDYADKMKVDKTSPLEQQKFAYTMIKNLRNNQPALHSYQRPPKISNTTNVSVGDTKVNDVYNKTATALSQAKEQGASLVPLTNLDADARELIVKSVNAGRNADNQIPIESIRLVLADNGEIRAVDMNAGGDVVGVFSPQGLNLKANTSQKQKQNILQGSNQPASQPKQNSSNRPKVDY